MACVLVGVAPLREHTLDWATPLRRVWHIDVLECPRCHGRLKVIAAISEPAVVHKILNHLDLPTTLPNPAPARAPPDDEGFDIDPPFDTDDAA